MHLEIIGKQIKVTDSLNNHIKDNLKKIKCYFDRIIHVYISLEVIKDTQIAEITITVDRHHFHNKVKSDDMYKSIDILFHKIERQVRRYKEYSVDKKKIGIQGHIVDIKSQEKNDIEITEKKIEAKPMSDLEAILQLSIADNSFVMGYYEQTEDYKNNIPNFVEKVGENHYNIYSHDVYWTEKSVRLKDNQIEASSIKTIKLSLETIEDSIDFMERNHISFRLFDSLRLEKPVLLNKIANKKYLLIREDI